ncbi:hypothetical protein C7212DRAFT_314737 [Tuber magnatum]|uniref:Uncharacterized protein n=1 Tax=Tuber magnatum TaxID=42249 RepID=A0A317SW25_9PEZI|nr:hypothetical protein C7212DRAFT_314737 [Tuber magnatum]
MEVRVCGWRVAKEEDKKGRVDWERSKAELKITEKWKEWEERKIEECRERRKWKWKNKKWWNEEIEEEYRRGKERLKEWRTKGGKEREEEVRRGKRELGRKIKTVKGDHWEMFLGEMGNLLEIEREEGKRVVGEKEKGREIIRGLGKREEREQEQEGFWERVELEEKEVEECLKKQGNRKGTGEDEIGGKVWREIWEEVKGRKVLTGVLKWSLEVGTCRNSLGGH